MKLQPFGVLALSIVLLFVMMCIPAKSAAETDPVQRGARVLKDSSAGRISVTLEERTRWEERYGINFGKDVSQQEMLSRLRIGITYQPARWLTISGMGQDARAPFYGKSAPNSMRESMDLQEAFVSFGTPTSPIRFSGGRRMLNYGETRLIGTPQWSNTSRTYDYGRLEYTTKKMRLDALMVSPAIVLPDSFNTPELGNRLWGAYMVLPAVAKGMAADIYALRHSQNKIGGWGSAGTLGTNSYGARCYGVLPASFKYSLEAIGQDGHLGYLDQRAYAWFAGLSQTSKLRNVAFDTAVDYKEASGSHAGSDHSATFDQLYAANHDKFGHMDLFGSRNSKSFRSVETLGVGKSVSFSVLYANNSLFSASDALYNGSGSKICISSKGLAGVRVGQELDSFATFKIGAHTFYAGFGHFFKGAFIEKTTPGINPRYFYIAQQYTLK